MDLCCITISTWKRCTWYLFLILFITTPVSFAQQTTLLSGWRMQDATQVSAPPEVVASSRFQDSSWYPATVPGTVLTTLVDNKVYPEPLFGENMRSIPETLNQHSYWYRTLLHTPRFSAGQHVWLRFGGINYSAEIWINGHNAGMMQGAFLRHSFDITPWVRAGRVAAVAVLVHPEPHPGTPHAHTIASGVGKNGGATALDGPTFLSTIGWDWLPAIPDRNTGIWQPVEVEVTGPVVLSDPFVTADLSADYASADLQVEVTLQNVTPDTVHGQLLGVIEGQGDPVLFQRSVDLASSTTTTLTLTASEIAGLRVQHPRLWWPNGYGAQNLGTLKLRFVANGHDSSATSTTFGIRRVQYSLPGSDDLAISVNGVRIMIRGGDWALDEGLKRETPERLDAEFRMHAQAHLTMIRNWVGQSTSPAFYNMADRYGMLLWDEFFQPNPGDGPEPLDTETYLANVRDKILRYRSHPSIVIWCGRNEGFPPPGLNDNIRRLMFSLDPQRLYQASSTDGRGISSHGPYYWRAPRFFYAFNESFKTETGSVSIPTLESIQGMMPSKDWEKINDDWAEHDLAAGAQRGNTYPFALAFRFGHIRNLADFARKGALADYETFRAMYEGRNAKMFQGTTGVLTWLSNPAHPSFVWQLYHYDLDPTASLFAVQKAAEPIHIQMNETTFRVEAVNNLPTPVMGLTAEAIVLDEHGKISATHRYPLDIPPSTTRAVAGFDVNSRITPLYFVKLNLYDQHGERISTNLYWQHVTQEDFRDLEQLPASPIDVSTQSHSDQGRTYLDAVLTNRGTNVALLTHLQLHRTQDGSRVLPAFYSDNFVSLVPGESVHIVVDCAIKDLHGDTPELLLDGYNLTVGQVTGTVTVKPNINDQPLHWPATDLVPDVAAK